MKLYDFECLACRHQFEALVRGDLLPPCPSCENGGTQRLMSAPKLFTTIVPDYPGSKKKKAGYTHSHGDRPKTPGKIQVGYTK